jgi:hypothetical protein
MKGHPLTCIGVLVIALANGADVQAQTRRAVDWQHGTMLSAFFGAASPSSETSPATGAGVGWEFTRRFAVEGRGIWLGAGRDAEAFGALLGIRFSPVSRASSVPFVSAGAGFYRASFGTVNGMPLFYRQRLEPRGRTVFDDFALTFGGGTDIFVAEHVALRPDFTVFLLATGSDVRVVPIYGVQLAYHFEPHSFALARR